MHDPRLISVADEMRRLKQEVSDAEWDDDPRLSRLVAELEHFKKLHADGVKYEPNF